MTDSTVDDLAMDDLSSFTFFGAYLLELYWLAAEAAAVAEQVFERMPARTPPDEYVQIDPDTHRDLYGVLSNASKIRALITKRRKRGVQSPEQFAFQERRIKVLREVIDSVDITEISSPDVRDSLEHFDERLDLLSLDMLEGRTPNNLRVLQNMVLSREAAVRTLRDGDHEAKVALLRVYYAEERVLVNLGHQVDIGRLAKECAAIRDRLAPLVSHPDTGERRGGYMFVLSAEQMRKDHLRHASRNRSRISSSAQDS